ncbi:MAG: glycosyltransferase, partial [Anaerolineae bacterium]|nr:glycosyltransferase [Gemmatimonadaceae bacterium]
YPGFEVIVVDDRSSDGTGAIAREIAQLDSRVRVIDARPLAEGWFGKQWACAEGAAASISALVCFKDADTVHAPDQMPRAVNALLDGNADMLSVAARQEMYTFWERTIQPLVFFMLFARYGGTEVVNRARNPTNKIANGQFILFRRDVYDGIGGHASVRDTVAEDLALAQRICSLGRSGILILGLDQLSTRMYTTLGEVVSGWMKNIYAGGRMAMPGGAAGRSLFPVTLLLPALLILAPVLVLGFAALLPSGALVWAAAAVAFSLLWWALVFRVALGMSPAYALTFPLGAAMLLYIVLRAIVRGSRVRWKDREYLSS